MDADKLRDLVRYLEGKRDHARQHGGAACETFDREEMEFIAAAVAEKAASMRPQR
jgi:hypothetical protein